MGDSWRCFVITIGNFRCNRIQPHPIPTVRYFKCRFLRLDRWLRFGFFDLPFLHKPLFLRRDLLQESTGLLILRILRYRLPLHCKNQNPLAQLLDAVGGGESGIKEL